jgi:hypothetical protein
LIELLQNIVQRALNVLYTLCQWAGAPKAIILPFKKLRNWQWQKDTDSLQDSTLACSEMPGELDQVSKYSKGIHTDEDFENLRKKL